MNIKSITLTVAEVTEILSITDDTLRRQALEAVTEAAAHPEKIDLNAILDGPSIILTLVHKVYRRYETALLRAENRAKKAAAAACNAPSHSTLKALKGIFTGKGKQISEIEVRINEPIVRRLLWIKQHFAAAVDNVTRALMAQDKDPNSAMLSDYFKEVADTISGYIKPLIDYASGYYRLPKNHRDGVFSIPVRFPA